MLVGSAGCNYWEPFGGGKVSPAAAGADIWLPTAQGVGNPTLQYMSQDRDVSAWGGTLNCTVTGGESDPDGGSTAYKLTETVDGGPVTHRTQRGYNNSCTTYLDQDIWLKSINRDWTRIILGTSAATQVYLNNTTGTVGTNSITGTVTLVETVSGWRHWRIVCREIPNAAILQVASADVDGNTNYVGTGLDAIGIYLPDDAYGGVMQRRVSTVVNYGSLGAVGDFTIGAAANEPLFWQNESPYGPINPAMHKEDGRIAQLVNTNAAVRNIAQVGAGVYPSITILGIGELNLGAAPFSYSIYPISFGLQPGPANHFDVPLTMDAAGALCSLRWDGAGFDVALYGEPAGALSGGPKSFAVVCKAGGTRDLYINGVGPYTAVLAPTGAINPSVSASILGYFTSGGAKHADLAVFAGRELARYEQIPIVKYMMTPYPGCGLLP